MHFRAACLSGASSAWEGTASSMTQKPAQAIAKPMISDIKNAKAK
ncbi:hypothetical protein PS682_03747 [Pseudomonas fluorescens]|jgi:hypothetical protein|nr:hypothetical protein [Pseudomonas lurida]VVN08425.1 hypothetical protein PS682_03747 [Pseudomonas fluorescens]VVP63595.1 hypothetical protein PS907_00531 [Pseudomonas fluorescens]